MSPKLGFPKTHGVSLGSDGEVLETNSTRKEGIGQGCSPLHNSFAIFLLQDANKREFVEVDESDLSDFEVSPVSPGLPKMKTRLVSGTGRR